MVAHMMATDPIVATACQNAGMVARSDWNIAVIMSVSCFASLMAVLVIGIRLAVFLRNGALGLVRSVAVLDNCDFLGDWR